MHFARAAPAKRVAARKPGDWVVDAYAAIDALSAGVLRADEPTAAAAFEDAWPVLRRRVLRHCLAGGVFRVAVQDEVAQEVRAETWRGLRSYRGTTTREFNGWFRRVSWARVCRAVASEAKQPLTVSNLAGGRGGDNAADDADRAMNAASRDRPRDENPAGPLMHGEEMRAMKDCLEQLQVVDEAAFGVVAVRFLADLDDPTFAVIARILDRPLSTVKEQSKRALDALRRCLEKKLE